MPQCQVRPLRRLSGAESRRCYLRSNHLASTRGVALLPAYARHFLPWSVISRPIKGDQPTIDLVIGYHRANASATLKSFLSRADELIARLSQKLSDPAGGSEGNAPCSRRLASAASSSSWRRLPESEAGEPTVQGCVQGWIRNGAKAPKESVPLRVAARHFPGALVASGAANPVATGGHSRRKLVASAVRHYCDADADEQRGKHHDHHAAQHGMDRPRHRSHRGLRPRVSGGGSIIGAAIGGGRHPTRTDSS
jgi:hypothetical protein